MSDGQTQFLNQSQGAVPAQTSGATVNPAQVLDQVLQRNTQELSKYALAAVTPVSSGSQGQFPASLNQPPKQDQPGQLDHREVVGAGNARAQGIGNSVIATLNTIAKVKTTLDNKKKVEIASSTQQLLQAQAAANQAKQLLAQDPNNAQAKEQVQHNEQIMGTILTGKHGKDIMKGFNIDYTDPESNKTIQHDAVADGKKRAEAATQAFNKGTPETMAPNTQAQAIYAAKQAEAKSVVETTRAMAPMLAAAIRAQASDNATQGRITAAKMKEIGEMARTYQNSQDQFTRLQERFAQQDKLENNRFGHRLVEIAAEGKKELEVFGEKLKSKNDDPLALNKAYEEHQRKGQAQIASSLAHIAGMENTKNLILSGDPKDKQGQAAALTKDIQNARAALDSYKAAFEGANTQYQNRLMGGFQGGPGSSTNKPGLDSAASYLSESDSLPDDDEDEEQP